MALFRCDIPTLMSMTLWIRDNLFMPNKLDNLFNSAFLENCKLFIEFRTFPMGLNDTKNRLANRESKKKRERFGEGATIFIVD